MSSNVTLPPNLANPTQPLTRHEKELIDLMAMNQSMNAPDITLSDTGRSVRSSTRTSTNVGSKETWLIPPEMKSRKWVLETVHLGQIRVKRWQPVGEALLGSYSGINGEMGGFFDVNSVKGYPKAKVDGRRRQSTNGNKPRAKKPRLSAGK